MRCFVLTALSAAVLAGPVLAQPSAGAASPTPAPAEAQASEAGEPDPNRRVCRSTIVTGSRLGKRKVCRTAGEWRATDIANQQSIRELQRTGGHDGRVHATPRGPGNPTGSRGGGG